LVKILEISEQDYRGVLYTVTRLFGASYNPILNRIYVMKSLSREFKRLIIREEKFHATRHRFPLLLLALTYFSCPLLYLIIRFPLLFYLEWDVSKRLYGCSDSFIDFCYRVLSLFRKLYVNINRGEGEVNVERVSDHEFGRSRRIGS